MRYATTAVFSVLVVGLLFVASGQAPPKKNDVVSALRVGQAISLTDAHHGYEIRLLTNGPDVLGHTIVDVLSDGIVVEDVARVNQTRIPIYSIKSIVVTTLPASR